MSDRAHLYTLLGPISPGARNFLGCFIRGSGQAAAPVVMVWVPAAIADNAEALKELALDTEAAEKLDHPNIIKVYGLEKLEQGWARIVEYADAEPLRAIIEAERTREGRISPALAASIVADACSGVHFAHETGEKGPRRHPILHGGLRPEVLQVTHDGRTKVTGYGAAAFAPVGKDSSRDAYTAPEQVLGGRWAMTRQTDVYQLGAVLYEAITGFQPFTAEDGVLETCILSKMPPPRGLSAWPELGGDRHEGHGEEGLRSLPHGARHARGPGDLQGHAAGEPGGGGVAGQ